MQWSGLTLPWALLRGGVGRSPVLCVHGTSQTCLGCPPLPLPTTLSLHCSRTDNPSLRNAPFSGNRVAFSVAMHLSIPAGTAGHSFSPVASDSLLTKPAEFNGDAALRQMQYPHHFPAMQFGKGKAHSEKLRYCRPRRTEAACSYSVSVLTVFKRTCKAGNCSVAIHGSIAHVTLQCC